METVVAVTQGISFAGKLAIGAGVLAFEMAHEAIYKTRDRARVHVASAERSIHSLLDVLSSFLKSWFNITVDNDKQNNVSQRLRALSFALVDAVRNLDWTIIHSFREKLTSALISSIRPTCEAPVNNTNTTEISVSQAPKEAEEDDSGRPEDDVNQSIEEMNSSTDTAVDAAHASESEEEDGDATERSLVTFDTPQKEFHEM